MSEYRLSPRAEADLAEIWDDTAARWGVEQADRYVREIAAACADLAAGRRQGRSMEDVRLGYLRFKVASQLLLYQRSNARLIEVVRLLHQRMDLARHLGGAR